MKQLITSLSLTIVKSLFDFDPASDGSEDFYDQAVTFELQICTLCFKLWPHYVDQRADYCQITVLPELSNAKQPNSYFMSVSKVSLVQIHHQTHNQVLPVQPRRESLLESFAMVLVKVGYRLMNLNQNYLGETPKIQKVQISEKTAKIFPELKHE